MSLPHETSAILERFSAAWASADPDRVMSLMTEDCVYEASVGPEPGLTFCGAVELRSGLETMFAHDAAARMEITDVFAVGDRAAWEWRYYDAAGALLARGCDLFVLRGGRIARKNAFRKTTA
jgi:ketosteroid isomerase-like protein